MSNGTGELDKRLYSSGEQMCLSSTNGLPIGRDEHSAIARRFNHSRRMARQVRVESEPRPYTLREDRPAPRWVRTKLIEQILAEDEQALASSSIRPPRSTVACGMNTLCWWL